VLFDNDHAFDTTQIRLREGCVIKELNGMTRAEMVEAYTQAVAVVDLWLPGAETVTAEGAMFDCCVIVANEMNGANQVDFPIDPWFKVSRLPSGDWNYTHLSLLLDHALNDYSHFVKNFAALKAHVLDLPHSFQASVRRFFVNDLHFMAAARSQTELELALPWAVSVLMNYPLATVQIVVPNRFQYGLTVAPALEVLRQRGLRQSLRVTDLTNGPSVDEVTAFGGDGHRAFAWGVSERAVTCVGDVRKTLLRPDLLDEISRNGSSMEGRRGAGKPSEIKCVRSSEFAVVPPETGWADWTHVSQLASWDGTWELADEDEGHSEGVVGTLSELNCQHLWTMRTNKVYAGVLPYFPDRFLRAMSRDLAMCGLQVY